jgi:hypothetical protein
LKVDDPNVLDGELLFRLVPPLYAHRNQANIIEISSGVFNSMSLSALRLAHISFDEARQADLNRNRLPKLDYGIAVISVHFVRNSIGGIVCIESDPEYPDESHVVIYRSKSGDRLSKSQYRGLTFGAHLAIPPKGI